MYKKIFLLILIFALNLLFGNESCSAGKVKPLININLDFIKDYKVLYEKPNSITEVFYINNKKVEVSHGGCEHYYFSFSFEIRKEKYSDNQLAKLAYDNITMLKNISNMKFITILNLLKNASEDKNYTLDKELSEINGYDELSIKLIKSSKNKNILLIEQSIIL